MDLKNWFKKYVRDKKYSASLRFHTRDKSFTSIEKAHTLGILFPLTDKADFLAVQSYAKNKAAPGRIIDLFGFIDDKTFPDFCISDNPGYYFNQKDLDWSGIPANDKVDGLIRTEYDIYIDMSLGDHFVYRYISSLSKARFKIGRYDDTPPDYFDLMIKSSTDEGLSVFVKNLEHYLSVIKP